MDSDRTLAGGSREGTATPGTGPEELTRGTVVGRYLLLGKLGAGGMGVVYAAHDPELDRKVALKLVLPQAGSSSEAARARLLREAQALARLSHPNVVAIHDVGTHGEQVWIAMEFVAGETLRAWVDGPARRWTELHRVLTDAARGVAAAHAAGLVHRDLKPDNVMIGADGRVRVMDFGLAFGRTPASPEPERTATVAAVTDSKQALAATARLGATLPVKAEPTRLTRGDAIAGTPAYMAPEQWRGRDAEAATDQFSWSVMAWELLYGERPFVGDNVAALVAAVLDGRPRPPPRARRVPGWLRRVVERGLASEPARRWPTMAALVAALERGKTLARVRTAVAGLVAVAVIGVGVESRRRWDVARRVDACAATGAEIDAAWDDAARQRLRAAFAATGLSYAASTAERVVPRLDEQTAGWRQARTEACMRSAVRGEWGEELLGRAVWCLEDRRMEIEGLVGEFGRADATAVQKAVSAVVSLRAAGTCLDDGLLRREPTPPAHGREEILSVRAVLSQARSLELAGDYKRALAAATRARELADGLDWPPLRMAARATEGELLEKTGDNAAAEAVDAEVYFEASRAGVWDVAADCAARLIVVVGYRLSRGAEGSAWARHAETAIAHAGDPAGMREAQRLSSLAIVRQAHGAYAEARTLHEQALALHEQALGAGHPKLARILNNLGAVHYATGSYAEARALHERAREILEQTLGPNHPDVASSLNNLAATYQAAGAPAKAVPLHERALEIRETALRPDHPEVIASLNNLAAAYQATGATAKAQRLIERAVAIEERSRGPDDPGLAAGLETLATIHASAGDLARALALVERARAIRERALGPDHPDVAASLHNVADVQTQLGAYAAARPLYERALAIRERVLGPDHPDVAASLVGLAAVRLAEDQPWVARTLLERAVTILGAHAGVQESEPGAQFQLARALVATGADPARALAAARTARDELQALGPGRASELADVEAWLSAQSSARPPHELK